MRDTRLILIAAAATLLLAVTSVLAQDETPQEDTQTPTLSARVFDPAPGAPTPIVDPAETISIAFTPLGAGVEHIDILDETMAVDNDDPVLIQKRREASGTVAVPFAVRGVQIDGEIVLLGGKADAPVWRETSPGVFEAVVENQAGDGVLRLTRSYTIRENRHGFVVSTSLENLSGQSMDVRLFSTAMIDFEKNPNGYAGDRRRVRTGFLRSPEQQGSSLVVHLDDDLSFRQALLGSREKDSNGTKRYLQSDTVWPGLDASEQGHRLSWIAIENRYHSVVVHPVLAPSSTDAADRLLGDAAQSVGRLVLNPYADRNDTVMVLTLDSAEIALDADAVVTLEHGVYAGPRTEPLLLADPMLSALNVPEMVVYNLGGFCAPCTFSWLTEILMGVLRVFHSMVQDWALAIMLLVVLVRSCLHPVTRWSQIRMQRFGVQMQSMAPKQKELREKYKDDPKKMQQEMTSLWREEGVSPMGMLGCLPMLLQSPVWIALYATLFYAYDLRHEPAFYGVFQNVSGGAWMFLADLSRADAAIPLPDAMHFSFPLWGRVDAINLLPILMGIVFFIHQKFLTPPTQATMTPEQESQQKMMKVMMVVMFPVIMYTAPSGLAIYFITNSTLGIVESKWIRSHMKKHGMLEIENIRAEKKKKGPGFLQRLNEASQAQKDLKEKGPRQPNPASRQFRNKQ